MSEDQKLSPETTQQDPPTMASLMDWHVGQMRDGFNEVRFVLGNKDEARAWATWIASQEVDVTNAG